MFAVQASSASNAERQLGGDNNLTLVVVPPLLIEKGRIYAFSYFMLAIYPILYEFLNIAS
jgi:hypothetical protein